LTKTYYNQKFSCNIKEYFIKNVKFKINEHGIENPVDIPDFILADMICIMIESMELSIKQNLDWHGCDSVCHPKFNEFNDKVSR